MKNKLFIAALALLALTACTKKGEAKHNKPTTPKKEAKIKKAEWLLGNWGNKMPDGNLTENWHKVNDSVYHGESYFVMGTDTVFAESVILDETGGKMAYTVTVPDQNDAKPVRFELTSITEKEMVFENPKHDFPNKIVYTQVKPDSLVAVISGIQKGKPASETFAMKRIK